jgi:hypothetical protein
MAVIKARVGDGRRKALNTDWDQWMEAADDLYLRFLKRVGVSPFWFHEVASAGFLASSAALAGFIPVAEYEITKAAADEAGVEGNGRADLWFASSTKAYSFELKRAWLAATEANLRAQMQAAYDDVARIPREEFHYASGLLVTRVRDPEREPIYEAFGQSEDVDLAWRIGPAGEDGAWLFFRLLTEG